MDVCGYPAGAGSKQFVEGFHRPVQCQSNEAMVANLTVLLVMGGSHFAMGRFSVSVCKSLPCKQ